MKLNDLIDKELIIKIRDQDYPVTVSGQGLPLLSIGIGTLNQRTLSERFKKQFKVYASNLYWDQRYSLGDVRDVSIDLILTDIADLGQQLKLKKFWIFGHSAYGLVALEFARKYPELVAGIIMSGSPINSNPAVASANNAYFDAHADSNRKMIDSQKRQQAQLENLALLLPSERFVSEYIVRDSARYWYVPDFDCSEVWQGIVLDNLIEHFFANILPKIDFGTHLEQIECPIFLAAGDYDYDCCPFFWKNVANLPKQMTISSFDKSGHWPHWEQQDLFDERIEKWLDNKLSLRSV